MGVKPLVKKFCVNMATIMSYIMFFGMIVAGFLIAYFSYDLYRLTKGGSRGWKYMTYACIPLGLYAIWGVIDTALGMSIPFRLEILLLVTGVSLFLFGLFMPLAIQRIGEDIKAGFPKCYTGRNILIFITLLYAVLITYNLMMPITTVAEEIVSIILFNLAIMSGVMAFGSFIIAKSSKKIAWWLFLVAAVTILLGVPGYQFYGDCCGSGWTENISFVYPECSGFVNEYSYAPVIHGSCIPQLIPVFNFTIISVIIATFFYLAAFTIIWRNIKSI